MDSYIFISVLSVMYSWIFCSALSAPAAETPAASTVTQGRHVRTKRCSCATFLDKECVYFCHLDIIWVNTPERVVSYGLGNAPRAKRAALDSMATGGGPRCRCVRGNDSTCGNFCRPRYDAPAAKAIRSMPEGDGCTGAQCKHKPAADTGTTRRMKNSNAASSQALRAALKTRLLLETWRARRRHRAGAWEGESAAS